MEIILVEPEVVTDLVHDRSSHLAGEILVAGKVGNEREGVEGDPRRRVAVSATLAARHPVEEAVELVALTATRCAARLDDEDQLVGGGAERLGEPPQRLSDEVLDAKDLPALLGPVAWCVARRAVWHASIVRGGRG